MVMRIAWILLSCFASVDIQCDGDFVLSVPQVLQHDLNPEGHLIHMTRSSLTSTRKTFYSAPVTHPSVFYQVPSLSSEPPPPLPSNFPSSQTTTSDNSNNNNVNNQRPDTSSSGGTVLTKPSAITTSEEDRLLLVPSSAVASSLPSISSSSSSLVLTANNNKVTGSSLSPNTALLIAFLLSLIPTLAISLPFFAFRRRRRVPVNFIPTGRMFFES